MRAVLRMYALLAVVCAAIFSASHGLPMVSTKYSSASEKNKKEGVLVSCVREGEGGKERERERERERGGVRERERERGREGERERESK